MSAEWFCCFGRFCTFIVFARSCTCTCIFTTLPDLSFGFFMQVRPVLPQGASGGIQGVGVGTWGGRKTSKGGVLVEAYFVGPKYI